MRRGKFYTFYLKNGVVKLGMVTAMAEDIGVMISTVEGLRGIGGNGVILAHEIDKVEPYFDEEDEYGCV